jgi:hypothetical protein
MPKSVYVVIAAVLLIAFIFGVTFLPPANRSNGGITVAGDATPIGPAKDGLRPNVTATPTGSTPKTP